MDRQILFKCPQTGLRVQQGLPPAAPDAPDTHVTVVCPACTRLHFINRFTGKLMGETEAKTLGTPST